MVAAQKSPFLLIALWTVIGLPEWSSACQFSPSCLDAMSKVNPLQEAVDRQDTQAVCSILPSKIHCLQVAVKACSDEDPSKRTSRDKSNFQLTIKLVEKMQQRFEEMCPSYTIPRNNSASRCPPSYHCLVPAFLLAALAIVTTAGHQWMTLSLPLVSRAS